MQADITLARNTASGKQIHAQVICYHGNPGHAQGERLQLGSLLDGMHVPIQIYAVAVYSNCNSLSEDSQRILNGALQYLADLTLLHGRHLKTSS